MIDKWFAKVFGPFFKAIHPVTRWIGPKSPLGPGTAGILFILVMAAIEIPIVWAFLDWIDKR